MSPRREAATPLRCRRLDGSVPTRVQYPPGSGCTRSNERLRISSVVSHEKRRLNLEDQEGLRKRQSYIHQSERAETLLKKLMEDAAEEQPPQSSRRHDHCPLVHMMLWCLLVNSRAPSGAITLFQYVWPGNGVEISSALGLWKGKNGTFLFNGVPLSMGCGYSSCVPSLFYFILYELSLLICCFVVVFFVFSTPSPRWFISSRSIPAQYYKPGIPYHTHPAS